MVFNVVILNLIVVFSLFISLFIKKRIKEELKAVNLICKVLNIVILTALTTVTLLNLNSFYLLIPLIFGFLLQNFIRTRFISVALTVLVSFTISLSYLFSFSSSLSLYYILYGYYTNLNKWDLFKAVLLHVILMVLLIGDILIKFQGVFLGFLAGLFINIIFKDLKEVSK